MKFDRHGSLNNKIVHLDRNWMGNSRINDTAIAIPSIFNLTLAEPIGFLRTPRPRSVGIGTTHPWPFRPQSSQSFAVNEPVGRYQMQQLVPKFRTSGQPVTSRGRAYDPNAGFWFLANDSAENGHKALNQAPLCCSCKSASTDIPLFGKCQIQG